MFPTNNFHLDIKLFPTLLYGVNFNGVNWMFHVVLECVYKEIEQTTLKLLQTFSNALKLNNLNQWPIKNPKDKFNFPGCWHTDTITNVKKSRQKFFRKLSS